MGGGKKKGGNRSNKKNAARKKSSPGLTGNNTTPPTTTPTAATAAAAGGIAPTAVTEPEPLDAAPAEAANADPVPVADRSATVPAPTQDQAEENPATAYTAETATKPTTTALEPESAGVVGGVPMVDLAPANHDTTTIKSNRVDAPLPDHVLNPFPSTTVAAKVPPVVATRDDAAEPQAREEAAPTTIATPATGAAHTRNAAEALGPNGADEGASVATLQSHPGVIAANSHPVSLAASSQVASQTPNVPPPVKEGAADVPQPHKVNDVTPLSTRQQIAAEQAGEDNLAPTLNGGNGAGPRKTPTGLGLGSQQPQDMAANGTSQGPRDLPSDTQPDATADPQATKRMSSTAQNASDQVDDATGALSKQGGLTQQPPTSAAPGTEESPGVVPPAASGGNVATTPATGTKTEVPHKPNIFKRAMRKVSRMFH